MAGAVWTRHQDDHRGLSTECKKWLDMAILDLQESKQNGAVVLEQAKLLSEEKALLEEKLNIHNQMWDFEKKQLEEDLRLLNREHEGKNIAHSYEIAALRVSLGSQQQEALCFKLRLEGLVDEVEFLNSKLQVLNLQLQEREVQFCEAVERHAIREARLKENLVKKKCSQEKALMTPSLVEELKKKHELEMEKLRIENGNLSLARKEEVSALLREKNFVWDQLKRMEDDYCNRLGMKKQELKAAEENLQRLQVTVDELQRAHDEKTVEATVLHINVQAAEDELRELREGLMQLKPSDDSSVSRHLKDLVMGSRSSSDRVMNICTGGNGPEGLSGDVNIEAGDCAEKQALLTFKEDQAAKLLVQKEEELKKARKVMDELRLENQNLRLLYVDLEGQFKDKQKPEKINRESAKDATTRNLTADLEAVAVDGTQSGQVSRDPKRRRLLVETSQMQPQPQSMSINRDGSCSMKVPNPAADELKAAEGSSDSMRLSQQTSDLRAHLSSSAQVTKNRLFSSVFGIPKVLART